MAVSRTGIVDDNFVAAVRQLTGASPRSDLDSPVTEGTRLSARQAMALFEAQLESRMLDLVARELKAEGEGFYTIGSSGHEGSAALGAALAPEDWSFLHYRSGGFFCARAAAQPGPEGPFDVLLGCVASSDEPIAGGRHKVFGSRALNIPPQTSTIASHLPKAVGCAISLERSVRLGLREADDAIVVCTFGDASSNHSTAAGAINAACWAAFQHLPCPVLFVCEDNGFGISVRTPNGWVAANYAHRPHLHYVYGDGLSLPSAWDAATDAIDHVRRTRGPAFLHLRTVRLLGHAGSDVEQLYRTEQEITDTEARDPVLASARLLIENGWLAPDDVLALYEATRDRMRALGAEAKRRPKLRTAEEVMQPLFLHDAAEIRPRVADEQARLAFHGRLPEAQERPRHLAIQLNRAMADVMLAHPESVAFGEDVARKGGVYHVTANLTKKLGVARVFNTLLDEQAILGLAIGAGHAGLLPIPEVQYLAYLMNAIDQLRGEAGSMQFFSGDQFRNPMVVRVAGLAYQKGFGGHFHNDNGIAAVREVPGVLMGCPSRGDDAARMLRTMVSAAAEQGRVCVLLEPIALYMTKDLHEDGDGAWLTTYPAPDEALPIGEIGVYGDGTDVCVISYANGLWMSLRVARRLEAEGIRCRVLDLRWLQPLPHEALVPHVQACGATVVVDECRSSSGIADSVVSDLAERVEALRIRRVTAPDTYIPLGAAANLVLVSEADIEDGIRAVIS